MEKRRYPTRKEKELLIVQQRGLCACGCGERLESHLGEPCTKTRFKGVQFDHTHQLGLDGGNEIENFRCLITGHHKVKTKRDAKARAKVRRIQAQGGLLHRKQNKREKAIARMQRTRELEQRGL